MNNKKKYFIFIGLILIALIGVSFAFFNYYMQGANRELIAGDIYLNMDETGGMVTLTNVFPETKEEARARTDNTVTFTIDGRNTTTNKTIYYEIMLDEGDTNSNYTNKINPKHLRFDLIEIINGEETMVVNNKSYKELNSTRIYVNQVDPNTSEVERTYQLRVWVDGNVLISDTDENADYPASTWKEHYASVKVSVYGDFEYKDMSTPASCFAYQEKTIVDESLYTYPSVTYELNTSEEAVNVCMDYMLNTVTGGTDASDAQDGYRSYCNGTGTINGVTFEEDIITGMWSDEQLTYFIENNVILNYEEVTKYYTLNTDEESVASCKSYMLNDWELAKISGFAGQDKSDAQDGYQSFCEGTGTLVDLDFKQALSLNADELLFINEDVDYFVANGVLTEEEGTVTGIEITNYDVETCGTDVVIPSQINGMDVISIADEASGTPATQLSNNNKFKNNTLEFNNKSNYSINPIVSLPNGVFVEKEITSVEFPNTLRYIGREAFKYNNLTTLEIPSSVTTIGDYAFYYNPLVIVDVKGKPSLGTWSFNADYPDDFVSPIRAAVYDYFKIFSYNGTCEELNSYTGVFDQYAMPQQIITTDTNACSYTNFLEN